LGYNVRISVRNVKIADDNISKSFLVLALELHTGERLLTVVNPKYAKKVDTMARGVKRISSLLGIPAMTNLLFTIRLFGL